MTQLTAAQAAQQHNRDGGGRYAERAHDEPAAGTDVLTAEPDGDAGSYLADDAEECVRAGMHLRHVGTDGYCNACGDDDPEAATRVWGAVEGIEVGSRSPWGAVQHAEEVAPGILRVGTAGHGGLKVTKQRNAAIPPAFRRRSGWYEEDDEACIVAAFHPDGSAAAQTTAMSALKDRWPDEFTRTFDVTVGLHESRVLRDRARREDSAAFRHQHRHDFVSTGWGTDTNGEWVPQGHQVLTARMDETGEEREFLVPSHVCVEDHALRRDVVLDPNRYLDVTGIGALGNPAPAPERSKITGADLRVSFDHLTGPQRSRAQAELNQRWRFPDDEGLMTTETLREHFERVGVTSKKPIAFSNRPGITYTVNYGGDRFREVTKATYDALAGVPDASTDADRASREERLAEQALERTGRTWDPAKTRAARERLAAASAARDAALKAESAADLPWAERQQMRADALHARAAERGFTFS